MNSRVNKALPAAAFDAPADFDRVAWLYRWMELLTFGPYLSRCRSAFLADCLTRRRALILGDGDGRFTAQLLNANPAIEIDAVDASAAMLASLLRRAGPDRERVQVFHADMRRFDPPHSNYDLIVTHFFLDCFDAEEIDEFAATLRKSVADNAIWLVSDFSIPPGWFGRIVAAPIIWALYRAFGILTGLRTRKLPDYAAALSHAGFGRKRRTAWLHNLLVGEIWTPKS